MPAKSSQLQIRVSVAQKTRLRQLARAAGQDLSTYVLARALPEIGLRIEVAIRALRDANNAGFGFAAFGAILVRLSAAELGAAIVAIDLAGLTPFVQNYVAAMVEHACGNAGIAPPEWTNNIAPLDNPWFATPLKSLRLHLLTNSPAAFRRRKVFDAAQ